MSVRLWQGTRGSLAAGLIILLLMGPRDRDVVDAPVLVGSDTPVTLLADALASSASSDIVYADSLPPSRGTSALMAGAAFAGSRITLLGPGTVPALSATPPTAPVAGRRSSLTVTIRGTPGAVVPVVVDDPTGAADTVSVLIGPPGVTTVSISVTPTRAGASEWAVHARGESAVVRAWTRPERTVRILVLSGPPSWESRYLTRALETAGLVVSVRQELGRAKAVATRGAASPTSLSDLDAFDVVAVLGPVRLPEDLMETWVRERGGGLLLVGPVPRSGTLRSWSAFTTRESRDAGTIRWSGPSEIVPLPAADLTVRVSTLPPPHAGVPVAWSGSDPVEPDAIYATAGWLGRGRLYASGITTWPWAMEAGLGAEYAEHWQSVVEWLAGGLRDGLTVAGGVGQRHVAWTGRLEGDARSSFRLMRPAGSGSDTASASETLRPVRTPEGDDYVRFVPLAPGNHALDPDLEIGAVVTIADDRLSWVSAALEIGGAGGALRSLAGGDEPPSGTPLGDSSRRPWLTFLLLSALAVLGWATRRWEGLP